MAEEAAGAPVGCDSHHRAVALKEKRVSRITRHRTALAGMDCGDK